MRELRSTHYLVFGKLQEELFGASVLEFDGSLGILSLTFNLDHSADAKPLMLDDGSGT